MYSACVALCADDRGTPTYGRYRRSSRRQSLPSEDNGRVIHPKPESVSSGCWKDTAPQLPRQYFHHHPIVTTDSRSWGTCHSRNHQRQPCPLRNHCYRCLRPGHLTREFRSSASGTDVIRQQTSHGSFTLLS